MYHKGLRVIIGYFFCKFDTYALGCGHIYFFGGGKHIPDKMEYSQ